MKPSRAALRRAEAATWGLRPCAEQPDARPRTISLIAWQQVIKGALRGFVTIELPSGLRLVDGPVLTATGKAWTAPPSKPIVDCDGRQKTDANGKPAFAAVCGWRTRELSDRFSEIVIAAIRAAHPNALDGMRP
jgi:hypothetical protein